MKVKDLIEALQQADPTGEREILLTGAYGCFERSVDIRVITAEDVENSSSCFYGLVPGDVEILTGLMSG